MKDWIAPGRTATAALLLALSFSAQPAFADPPKIFKVGVKSTEVHPGDHFIAWLKTSHDATKAQAKAFGHTFDLVQQAPGVFMLDLPIPHGIPFFLKHKYGVTLSAYNAANEEADTSVDIKLK